MRVRQSRGFLPREQAAGNDSGDDDSTGKMVSEGHQRPPVGNGHKPDEPHIIANGALINNGIRKGLEAC
jgi:hypothetical protein